MSDWHYREAVEGDLPAIAKLDVGCFGNPWSAEVYRQELVRPFARLTVVETAGPLVGLSCVWQMGDEAHLLRIATHAQVRRRGLGRALLERALGRAATAGCRRMLLEVAAGNTAAVRLYERAGFELIGRRARYYSRPPDDALVLSRRLDVAAAPAERPPRR